MLSFKRTDSANDSFLKLVKKLDAELKIRDGEEHEFYAKLNTVENIKQVIIAYKENSVIGCGALREYSPGIVEIKRMYVDEDKRGMGIATKILLQLEMWARECGYEKCILETGINQPEAIALYHKNQFSVIPNYGKYESMKNSVCFEKYL